MAVPDTVDASLLKALGHPLRLSILTLISERGEASPVELSRTLDQSLARVSHHVRVLRDLGYIELSRTMPRRGALEHYYRAVVSPFLDDGQWERLPVPVRRGLAAQTLRQVFREAAAAGPKGGFDSAGAHIARLMLELDARGWRELSRAVVALLTRAQAIQERSDARRDGGRGERRASELAILHFDAGEPAGSASAAADRATSRERPPRIPLG
jgi:DNA-binding transcriptional ArsR family regulator